MALQVSSYLSVIAGHWLEYAAQRCHGDF